MFLEIKIGVVYVPREGLWQVRIRDKDNTLLKEIYFISKHEAEVFLDDYVFLFSHIGMTSGVEI